MAWSKASRLKLSRSMKALHKRKKQQAKEGVHEEGGQIIPFAAVPMLPPKVRRKTRMVVSAAANFKDGKELNVEMLGQLIAAVVKHL